MEFNSAKANGQIVAQTPPVTVAAGMSILGPTLPVQHPLWQSESGGGSFLTGTEGWVKYILEATSMDPSGNTVPSPELVYIHWDNPFVWDKGTTPIYPSVTVTDVTPPCNANQGGTFTGIGTGNSQHEPFMASDNNGGALDFATGPVGIGFDIALFWPAILTFAFLQAVGDIHLEFTLVFPEKRQRGLNDVFIL